MNTDESKYIEKKAYLSRYTHERTVALKEPAAVPPPGTLAEKEWLRALKEDLPKFLPFLAKKCGLEFRGRILEIGAGGAWLSAEMSKLPRVVEVVTTDLSPRLLKEEAPRVFKLLKANTAKITRTPGDFHKLDFPADYFDFVVCSAVLHHAANMVQVIREAKRVLKPGGRLVAIREPIWPWMQIKSRTAKKTRNGDKQKILPSYSLKHYKEFFKQAALPVEVHKVNLSSGFRYYLNKVVNGLTHARYAFVATKKAPRLAAKR